MPSRGKLTKPVIALKQRIAFINKMHLRKRNLSKLLTPGK